MNLSWNGIYKGLQSAFITKARVQLKRDMGMATSPNNAFLLNLGLETHILEWASLL